jgi:hypothetical protein
MRLAPQNDCLFPMPRDGIEPPTRGFSVNDPKLPKLLKLHYHMEITIFLTSIFFHTFSDFGTFSTAFLTPILTQKTDANKLCHLGMNSAPVF